MTAEELLKPRVRCTGNDKYHFPGSIFSVGDILTIESWDSVSIGTKRFYLPDYFKFNIDNYPHLFQKIEWWEDRKPEDMPDYVKTKAGNSVRMVESFNPATNQIVFVGGRIRNIRHWMPATELEYKQFAFAIKTRI